MHSDDHGSESPDFNRMTPAPNPGLTWILYPTQTKDKLMKNRRYSLRTLLIATAVFAAYFPVARLYHLWFATAHDSYYVTSVLASEIHNGDTVAEVATHFASQRLLTDAEENAFKNIPGTFGGTNRTIDDGDTCYSFSTHGGSSVLMQFRDGQLINLPNESYSDAALLAEMNGYSLPNPVLLYGVLPFYLIFVACIALILSSGRWLRRSRGSDNSLVA